MFGYIVSGFFSLIVLLLISQCCHNRYLRNKERKNNEKEDEGKKNKEKKNKANKNTSEIISETKDQKNV